MDYPHLSLRAWPFRIVPEPELCDFLGDRTALRRDLELLLTSLGNRPTSDIQLLWSWYGAGKTHTLYYIANRCRADHRGVTAIYTELPREAKGFIDLYRSSIAQIDVDVLVDAFLEHSTRPVQDKPAFGHHLDIDLASALRQAAVSDRHVQVALGQWLLGNALTKQSMRELGVGGKIDKTEKCASVFGDVVKLLAPQGGQVPSKRIIWIIDEVQRVEDLTPNAQRSVLSGLVGLFNRCPAGLTIMLSYTGEPKQSGLPDWIPDDLKDRIGLERPMLLPPLGVDDAALLIRELLANFRSPGSIASASPYFPFEESAIQILLKALSRKGDLKPRALMEVMDASLRVLEPQMRAGTLKSIDLASLKASLERLDIDWSEQPKGPKGKR